MASERMNDENVDNEIAKFRLAHGLCPYCGAACYTISTDPVSKERRIFPLTIAGVVNSGRCLFCYPIPDSSPVTAAAVNDANFENNQRVPASVVSSSPARRASRSNTSEEEEEETPRNKHSSSTTMSDISADEMDGSSPRRRNKRNKRKRDGDNEQDDRKMPARSTTTASQVGRDNHQNGTARIVTPGFRQVKLESDSESEDDTDAEEKEKREVRILDHEEREYKGHLLKGTLRKGVGRFEYVHVGQDQDNDLLGNVSIYEGSFACGKMNGKGKLSHARGTVYEGAFRDGAPHGYGSCLWPSGWKYEGDWVRDERQGKGKVYQVGVRDGEEYDGEWKEDKRHGKGELKVEGGRQRCVGSFANDEINGKATYYWEDGTVYDGYFKNGLRSGVGEIEYGDGSRYIGHWKNNKREGMGTEFDLDGSCYKGSFKDDAIDSGTKKFPDGTRATYKQGQLQTIKPRRRT